MVTRLLGIIIYFWQTAVLCSVSDNSSSGQQGTSCYLQDNCQCAGKQEVKAKCVSLGNLAKTILSFTVDTNRFYYA